MSPLPENNVSAPIVQMTINELKASFLMTMQDIERRKREFIEIPVETFTQEQIDSLYHDLVVMFNNVESIHDRIETLKAKENSLALG